MDTSDLKPVVTQDLQILDGQGRRRAWITTTLFDGNPSLTLYDEAQCERVSIHLNNSGQPSIAILDELGRSLVGLGQNASGEIGIQISDADGKPGMLLTIQPDGARRIAIVDRDGKTVSTAPARKT
jgi:hypothetical protein